MGCSHPGVRFEWLPQMTPPDATVFSEFFASKAFFELWGLVGVV
jgi:hypothetical protein